MPNSSRRCFSAILFWAAMLTRAGQAQTTSAPAPFKAPEDVAFRTVSIVSEGTRIAAEVYSLKSLEGKRLPAIVLCHGWGGTASNLRPEGIAFARAGYLALAIDYRGWGASDARLILTGTSPSEKTKGKFTAEVQEVREVVDPIDQTTDLMNAIHWVAGDPQCDAAHIGLWGSSYSGGHVVYAAARDPRVKATVSQVPALDSRWVVSSPLAKAQTYRDATRRARGEIGYPEPGARVMQGLRGAPISERMINYAPVEDVANAPGCAMLFVVAEKEEYFDNKDHGLKAFDRARGPKKLVTIPGITHYGIYGPARPQAQKLAIAWFDEHLKGVKQAAAEPSDREKDWASYNGDLFGSRHNRAETALGPETASRLELKWRFPPEGSDVQIGVIHATPIVVGGYVYFGTATDPAFYKLTPDGKVRWTYRNPAYSRGKPASELSKGVPQGGQRFQSSENGTLASALVEGDTVYFGDSGGWFCALDRATGAERWRINARGKDFPGSHPINVFLASPIMALGKLIVAGGTLEQLVTATPFYRGASGRGFVLALEPRTGRIIWKYDLGEKPEPLDPPITITDSWGRHTFYFGPGTSSIWSTPSFDSETGTIFFGTDVNTAPRRPTSDDPRPATGVSCAIVALDVKDGKQRWVTQINPGDVWTNSMRSYDPKEGRYKDQSIGDTPKIYTISIAGKPVKVVGAGCKNGGFYVLRASDGQMLEHTPVYNGPPAFPLSPEPDPRMLALPSCIGGLQTGCATDGKTIFTNGIDALLLGSQEKPASSGVPPSGGRVVAISLDSKTELWRHERPRLASVGGPPPKAIYKDVGDPVASGIAVANGVVYFTTVASGKLVVLNAATGSQIKEIDLGPVWSGPSVSRGRVYVGTGNILFNPGNSETFFPKNNSGVLYSFGLPGQDEVSRMGAGSE
jgi:outer membrane protein assembly factor BamB/dienelactone hydrolase